MKVKPLLGIVALLITFLCVVKVAAGWLPGEERMLETLRQASTAEIPYTAENKHNNLEQQSVELAPDLSSVTTTPTPSALSTTSTVSDQTPASLCTGGASQTVGADSSDPTTLTLSQYHPREEVRIAHPSNYGDRFQTDVYGRPVRNEYIVVLHETVYSANSAINYFQTPHVNDDDQASYHTLLRRDGTVVYVVPPEKRAYGAGNSIFSGVNGPESVKTKRDLAPSVNNFAYHVSLETPSDGANENRYHSGYSDAQYRSLAWLLAKTSIPESRITTHRQVDRSGSRLDPRSFDQQKFLSLLRAYPRVVRTGGVERCIMPSVAKEP